MNVYLKLWLALAIDKCKFYFSIKSLDFFAFVSLGKNFRIMETSFKVAYGVYQSHDHFQPQINEVNKEINDKRDRI